MRVIDLKVAICFFRVEDTPIAVHLFEKSDQLWKRIKVLKRCPCALRKSNAFVWSVSNMCKLTTYPHLLLSKWGFEPGDVDTRTTFRPTHVVFFSESDFDPKIQWIGLKENLQETMFFLPSNVGVSCKFSHPILWQMHLNFKIFRRPILLYQLSSTKLIFNVLQRWLKGKAYGWHHRSFCPWIVRGVQPLIVRSSSWIEVLTIFEQRYGDQN